MWGLRRLLAGLVLGLVVGVVTTMAAPPPSVRAQESVNLVTGCNNVALAFTAGTPISQIAGQIQPPSALRSIFRFDAASARFVAFSPAVPATVNDYLVIDRRLEAVYICMTAPGLLPGGPVVVVPPVAVPISGGQRGVISAPARLVRGQSAEIVLGVGPNIACTGGINIPAGGTFRFVRVSQGSTPAGNLVIKFDVDANDDPTIAYLVINCADGQAFRLNFPVV